MPRRFSTLFVMVLLVGLLSGCGSQAPQNNGGSQPQLPEPVKSEQLQIDQGALRATAFDSWEEQYRQQSKMMDEALETWKNIFQNLTDGKVSEYAAYDELRVLEKQLGNIFSRDFTDSVESIESLSEGQRDLLKDAFEDMFTAIYFRQEATRAALRFFDNPIPGNAQKIKDNMELSDSCIVDSAAKVAKIKLELGLLE